MIQKRKWIIALFLLIVILLSGAVSAKLKVDEGTADSLKSLRDGLSKTDNFNKKIGSLDKAAYQTAAKDLANARNILTNSEKVRSLDGPERQKELRRLANIYEVGMATGSPKSTINAYSRYAGIPGTGAPAGITVLVLLGVGVIVYLFFYGKHVKMGLRPQNNWFKEFTKEGDNIIKAEKQREKAERQKELLPIKLWHELKVILNDSFNDDLEKEIEKFMDIAEELEKNPDTYWLIAFLSDKPITIGSVTLDKHEKDKLLSRVISKIEDRLKNLEKILVIDTSLKNLEENDKIAIHRELASLKGNASPEAAANINTREHMIDYIGNLLEKWMTAVKHQEKVLNHLKPILLKILNYNTKQVSEAVDRGEIKEELDGIKNVLRKYLVSSKTEHDLKSVSENDVSRLDWRDQEKWFYYKIQSLMPSAGGGTP